jgi:hypothetical protein
LTWLNPASNLISTFLSASASSNTEAYLLRHTAPNRLPPPHPHFVTSSLIPRPPASSLYPPLPPTFSTSLYSPASNLPLPNPRNPRP